MFKFDASKITTKDNFYNLVGAHKLFLEKRKKEIFEEYSFLEKSEWDGDFRRYNNFRDDYLELTKKILNSVISDYRRFLPEKCLIIEFGSFAKRTERVLSDFDFTICYDTPKTEQYEVAELLIDYSLACIFDFSIDHVHGKFQHYPDMPELSQFSEKDNLYRLIFSDGYIDFKCGPETLIENLMNIKNVRDYSSMMKGYEEKYIHKCNIDCLYSVNIIENSLGHDFIKDMSELESQYDICSGYEFDTNKYYSDENIKISELKKILKAKGLVEFYIFIASLRKITKFQKDYSMQISEIWRNSILISIFGVSYISALEVAFTKFIFFFNRLELSLSKIGVPLSTRCYEQFTKNNINKMLSTDWGGGTHIDAVLESRNQLVELIGKGLFILKSERLKLC